MRRVIIRDDDTNAFTPVACLDRLYRPFLDRGMPINLAVIPDVAPGTRRPDGVLEQYLFGGNGSSARTHPLVENRQLVAYLHGNSRIHVVQHGCHHDYLEFDESRPAEIARRLDHGAAMLMEAGFQQPRTFVAPYDRLSRASLTEVGHRFRVLSTGWFEWRRLPLVWRPWYALRKFLRAPHWQVGKTRLLSHPGCLLSRFRPLDTMLEDVTRHIRSQSLTVLVTHWWEYFPGGEPDEAFISVLHQTADYLGRQPDIEVVSFDDVADGAVPIH